MAEIGVILFILGVMCLPIGIIIWIIRAIMKKNTTKNLKFTCISMAAIIIGFALLVMSPTEENVSVTNEVVSDEEEKIEVADAEVTEESSEPLSEVVDVVMDEDSDIVESLPEEESESAGDIVVQTENLEDEEVDG